MDNFVERNSVEVMCEEVEKCLKENLFLSALHLSLSFPDILGQLEYDTGNNNEKYIRWFDEFVKNDFGYPYYGSFGRDPSTPQFTGEVCYKLRCGLFHELTNEFDVPIDEFVISLDPSQFYTGGISGTEVKLSQYGWRTNKYLYVSAKDLSSKILEAVSRYLSSHPDKDYPKIKMNERGAKCSF